MDAASKGQWRSASCAQKFGGVSGIRSASGSPRVVPVRERRTCMPKVSAEEHCAVPQF
jgi:hypothetical protein